MITLQQGENVRVVAIASEASVVFLGALRYHARMRRISVLVLSLSVVVAAACSEDDVSSGGGDLTSGGGGAGHGVAGGDGSGAAWNTGGAPPCTAQNLTDSVRLTSVDIVGAKSSRALTAQSGSASVVAWAAADGIHITPLGVADKRAGADIVVEGDKIFGLAASATDIALLVSRPPDFMTFKRIDLTGKELASTDLVGGGDHKVKGTEWFGGFANAGRLVARDDGTYAAYHSLHRLWPDNIGHQGDTLRLLAGDGSALGGGWDWGCSHSEGQRLAFGPTGLVPICISDCYPSPGVLFNHKGAKLSPDPTGNCKGSVSVRLGGLVVVSDGFFLVFQDATGGAHLGHYDGQGGALDDRSLSVEGTSRLALYGVGMLMGSAAGADSTSLQILDAAGKNSGAPATISMALPEQDFEGRSDGEVAWAEASGSTLKVARVRNCQ